MFLTKVFSKVSVSVNFWKLLFWITHPLTYCGLALGFIALIVLIMLAILALMIAFATFCGAVGYLIALESFSRRQRSKTKPKLAPELNLKELSNMITSLQPVIFAAAQEVAPEPAIGIASPEPTPDATIPEIPVTPTKKVRSKFRGSYAQKDFDAAITAINGGMAVKTAARKYGVPESTIRTFRKKGRS